MAALSLLSHSPLCMASMHCTVMLLYGTVKPAVQQSCRSDRLALSNRQPEPQGKNKSRATAGVRLPPVIFMCRHYVLPRCFMQALRPSPSFQGPQFDNILWSCSSQILQPEFLPTSSNLLQLLVTLTSISAATPKSTL
ncbi:hypothetical protein V8C34DRAFT_194039 [Trichoderma compactum]